MMPVPPPLLMRLLLLAAAASAATAAGDGCSTGCDLALGSYNIGRDQNLTYIASLFGVADYRKLEQYNNPGLFPNLDYIRVDSRVAVPFPCRCLALPTAPFSTYLAGSFPYRVSPGENYSSIAAKFNNLTTAAWLQATNSKLLDGGIVNVTVNCSCRYPGVPPDYKLFLTYPLRDGETLESVEEKYSFPLQSDMDSRIVYVPLIGVSANAPAPAPAAAPPPPPTDSFNIAGPWRNKKIIIATTSSVLGVSVILISLFLCYKNYYGILPWQRGSRNAPRIESFLQKQGTSHPKRYSYSEVRRMTTSFAHKLGQGGYGAVYRGNLPDGREIAVKMLKDTEGDGEEFMNEVASISRTSHVNIVTLLGFCLQGSKRALLYEYMPNGSLERYTFGSNLSWDKLFDIVIGIARGLEYLHTGCNTRIVHFDIKPQNILLDQEFSPKISDFGLAKLCQQKESKISIVGARGTIGYIAPEVFSRNYGAVGSKADVYSYGMVILEMVGARKQIDISTNTSSKYFPQWLYDNLDQFCGATTCEIGSNTTEVVRKMIIVGLWCIQFIPADRPTMSKVLEMLETNTMDLQLPPNAF